MRTTDFDFDFDFDFERPGCGGFVGCGFLGGVESPSLVELMRMSYEERDAWSAR